LTPLPTAAPRLHFAYTGFDGGNTWTQHVIAKYQNVQLHSVSCSGNNGKYCTVVGEYVYENSVTVPVAYTTEDGGNTWTSNIISTEKNSHMDIRSICSR